MKTSNYVIYTHVPETDEYYLVHGYSGAVDRVSPAVVRYLLDRADPEQTWHIKDQEAAAASLEGRDLPEPTPEAVEMLRSRGYLTGMSSAEEREYVGRLAGFLHRKNLDGSAPAFMFVPSYECNLRCPYCYEADTRVQLSKLKVLRNTLTPEMVDAAYKSMDAIAGARFPGREKAPRKTTITLYGGEPLALENLPAVEYICEQGVERGYTFSAITNAVDLHHFLHLLGPGKIEFLQITLDGPKAIHDRKRIGPRYKGGTYDRIVGNIKLALETGVRISVRYHVDFNNVSCTRELVDDLKREGFSEHKNFSLYTYPIHMYHKGVAEPVHPLMGIHEMHDEVHKLAEAARAERAALPSCGSGGGCSTPKLLKIQLPDDGIKGKLKSYLSGGVMGLMGQMEPCGATVGLYIFDPYGKIYTCWDSVGVPGQEIGTYSAEGPVLNALSAKWLDRSPAVIEECKGCKYALLHFGGCAALPADCQGTIYGPACYGFQDNFTYIARRFFRDGLEKALQDDAPPAVNPEAMTAAEAAIAGS